MQYVINLNRLFNNIKINGGFQPEIITSIFINIRKLIESKNENKKYKVLMLYCNWLAHSKLERESTGLLILENIMNIIFESINRSNIEEIVVKISQEFSFTNLYNEINELFDVNSISKLILDKSTWNTVIKIIIVNIDKVPINLNNNKQEYLRLFEKAKHANQINNNFLIPKSLYLTIDNGKVFWNIEMQELFTLTGPLVM